MDTVALTVLGYPLSWVELLGTALYLWSVWLISKARILTWPVGILSVLLYMVLFMQIRLYSDALEQVYYLVVSVYGWVTWKRLRETDGQTFSPRPSSPLRICVTVGVALVAGLLAGALMSRIHLWLPAVFPAPADFPLVDAVTTVLSLVAMWLLTQRRIEAWVYWIIVDSVAVWLYWVKDVKFLSLLYVVLLVIAVNGLLQWRAWLAEARREEAVIPEISRKGV